MQPTRTAKRDGAKREPLPSQVLHLCTQTNTQLRIGTQRKQNELQLLPICNPLGINKEEAMEYSGSVLVVHFSCQVTVWGQTLNGSSIMFCCLFWLEMGWKQKVTLVHLRQAPFKDPGVKGLISLRCSVQYCPHLLSCMCTTCPRGLKVTVTGAFLINHSWSFSSDSCCKISLPCGSPTTQPFLSRRLGFSAKEEASCTEMEFRQSADSRNQNPASSPC